MAEPPIEKMTSNNDTLRDEVLKKVESTLAAAKDVIHTFANVLEPNAYKALCKTLCDPLLKIHFDTTLYTSLFAAGKVFKDTSTANKPNPANVVSSPAEKANKTAAAGPVPPNDKDATLPAAKKQKMDNANPGDGEVIFVDANPKSTESLKNSGGDSNLSKNDAPSAKQSQDAKANVPPTADPQAGASSIVSDSNGLDSDTGANVSGTTGVAAGQSQGDTAKTVDSQTNASSTGGESQNGTASAKAQPTKKRKVNVSEEPAQAPVATQTPIRRKPKELVYHINRLGLPIEPPMQSANHEMRVMIFKNSPRGNIDLNTPEGISCIANVTVLGTSKLTQNSNLMASLFRDKAQEREDMKPTKGLNDLHDQCLYDPWYTHKQQVKLPHNNKVIFWDALLSKVDWMRPKHSEQKDGEEDNDDYEDDFHESQGDIELFKDMPHYKVWKYLKVWVDWVNWGSLRIGTSEMQSELHTFAQFMGDEGFYRALWDTTTSEEILGRKDDYNGTSCALVFQFQAQPASIPLSLQDVDRGYSAWCGSLF